LLSAQDANGKASPSDSLKDLFAQIDTNGDGKITKAEFEDKLGAGGTNIAAADNVFNKWMLITTAPSVSTRWRRR
jgi:Ca2+-binding EF-hand superfamily protein